MTSNRINYVNLISGRPMELWGVQGKFHNGQPLWDKTYSLPPLAGAKMKNGVGDPDGLVEINPVIDIEIDDTGNVKDLDPIIQAMETELHRVWDLWREAQQD